MWFFCDRVPGLLEASVDGDLTWRFGFLPPGVGIEDSMVGCDPEELGPYPEIFDHLPTTGEQVPIVLAFDGFDRLVLTVDQNEETFQTQP